MMFWHIARREIHDNMTSLRFGLTVIALVSLMVINALVFTTKGYKERMDQYRENVAGASEKLRENCSSLQTLITKGPGTPQKEPSPLAFCADGGEDDIPGEIIVRRRGLPWGPSSLSYRVGNLWRMYYTGRQELGPSYINYYVSLDRNLRKVMPDYLKTDWAFIIGVLVSFLGILLTHDSISGEKERGILRLILGSSVSRSSVILGKFVGAFISIMLPLSVAILLNLLIVNVSGATVLGVGHWGSIGMIALVSVVYVSVFICLGILVSAFCSRSRTSLLILLLIWVVFVVLMPNMLGSIFSGLKEIPSEDEVFQRVRTGRDDLLRRYANRGLFQAFPSREDPDMKAMRLWADYLDEDRQVEESIMDRYVGDQLEQIHTARQITRISPTAIYRYALESLSGTGLERHRDFIRNVRIYRDIFWEYIRSEDAGDPDSLHVYFVREGVSDKPANFDNAPRFAENLSLTGMLHDALLDMAILSVLAIFLFMASYISFMRADVR